MSPRKHNTVPLGRWPELGATIQVTYIPGEPCDPPECDTALFTCRAKDTDLTLEQARALRDDLVALVAAMEGAPDPATLEGLETIAAAANRALGDAQSAIARAVTAAAQDAWPKVQWRTEHGSATTLVRTGNLRTAGLWVLRVAGEWRVDVAIRCADDGARIDRVGQGDDLAVVMNKVLARLDPADADAVRAALGVTP